MTPIENNTAALKQLKIKVNQLPNKIKWIPIKFDNRSSSEIEMYAPDPVGSCKFDLTLDTLPAVILICAMVRNDNNYYFGAVLYENPSSDISQYCFQRGDKYRYIDKFTIKKVNSKFDIHIEYIGNTFEEQYYMILPAF